MMSSFNTNIYLTHFLYLHYRCFSHPVADGSLHLVCDDVISAAVQTASSSAGYGCVRVSVCVAVVCVVVVMCV